MDALDMVEVIHGAAAASAAHDEEQLSAYVAEFERRLVAGQRLTDEAVYYLELLIDGLDDLPWAGEALSTVLRRHHSLISEAHKRTLNAALRSAEMSVIFDAAEMGERIRQAAAAGNADWMEGCYLEFEDLNANLERYPEGSLDLIGQLLGEPGFRAANCSSKLLMIFVHSYIMDEFSAEVKERLLPAIEAAYGEFADPSSSFMISEGFGEMYPDERGFEVLRRLMHVPQLQARCFVPHALEHLVKAAKDPQLAARAKAELRSMRNDPSEYVRYEVALSLRRLWGYPGTSSRVPNEKRRRPNKESRTGRHIGGSPT